MLWVVEQPLDRVSDRCDVTPVEKVGSATCDFGKGCRIRAGDRHAPRHRL